jgi:hypothetical protein
LLHVVPIPIFFFVVLFVVLLFLPDAFQGDGGDAFTISLNEITQFANDFGIFDRNQHVFGLANLDLAFTACNVEIKGTEDNNENPNRELCRYEFIEMLVRIALDKYKISMKNNRPNEMVRRLLDDHIVKFAYEKIAQADGVDETRELINQRTVELGQLDGEYNQRLQDLFTYACRMNNANKKSGSKRRKHQGIEIDAFFELLKHAGLPDDDLTQLEIRQSFVDAQDDGVMGDSKVADFQEFREALIRVAHEKWEGDTAEGMQPIDVKYQWLLSAMMHLYDACRKGEHKDKLAGVVSSKLIKNYDLSFSGNFWPLKVGLGVQVQCSENRASVMTKKDVRDTETSSVTSSGSGHVGF